MSLDAFHSQQETSFLEAFNISSPYVPPPSQFSATVDSNKILCIADPHCPYESQSVFETAWAKESSAECVFIPGDVGDFFSKSRFRRTKHVSFRDEVRAIFYRLEWLSVRWRKVVLMLGNHDNRPEKKIQDLFSVDTELLILTEQNLLKHLAAYFPNVEVVEHHVIGGPGLTYLYQWGDMLFCHAELSRTQATATMEYISAWCHRWKHILKLNPYRMIVQAHNHQSMKRDVDGETWLMVPSAADPLSLGMEYIFSSRMPTKNPPAMGYAVITHDNGYCVPNESHNYIVT